MCFVGQRSRQQVVAAVVVVVAKVHSHERKRLAIVVIRHAGRQRDFLEGAVAAVAEQEVRHRVVGDKCIEAAVSVEISEGYPHALALVRRDSGLP